MIASAATGGAGAGTAATTDALTIFETAPRRPRYWIALSLLMFQSLIESFDFVVVGFIMTIVAPAWGLSFGQTSIILLSAGLGQLAGALPFARFADRYGRRPALLIGIALYSLAAFATAFVPDGQWVMLAILRFLIGVGYGGTQITLLIEMAQTRWRTIIAGAAAITAPGGAMLAAVVFAGFVDTIGWRGVALVGGSPLLFAVVLYFFVPESVRWLLATGRSQDARDVIARYVRVNPGDIVLPPPPPPLPPARFRDVDVRSSRFWLIMLLTGGVGVAAFSALLWGPTLLKIGLGSATDAARLFIWVSAAGIAGRVIWMLVPHFIGRWPSALICSAGAVASALLIAFGSGNELFGLPVILLALMAGAIFYDGGFANITPFATELYPVRLAALGGALASVASGISKLVGPILLALVAGSSNLVTPGATAEAIRPAFLLIAIFPIVAAAALLRFRLETNGVAMAQTGVEAGSTMKGAPDVR